MTVTPEDSTDAVRVRDAERADLLAVHSIEKSSFPSPWPLAAFERHLSSPAFLVAVDGTADGDAAGGTATESIDAASVLGYVVADLVPNHGRPLGHVKDIAVHPDRRGEGVGSALLEAALTALATESVGSVKLEVRVSNESAQSLYQSFGFEPLRRVPRYYDDGEDAIIMVRQFED
ncbi:ribosomal-protein-alanine N-acetyltransferase [Natronoarchaeum philippinense]|uniref:Ribosomal-protein-alanine N-acetyltransferase n=1 Tax=Natronoarchaeum philippinense TaxID=558529 RepID=A0A285NXN5_NATPI|nr:ribosomal protein S18-alanine N-acetyltransferase [Natronoarchaeum philippinense]SNZ12411.1 ribosomal-protein-alanine N-acetyltransferase [Natronoarchaeum philippinense]